MPADEVLHQVPPQAGSVRFQRRGLQGLPQPEGPGEPGQAEGSKSQMRILNLGAGVQSTTIALMGVKNWYYWSCSEPLPYPAVGLIEFAIFADTQEEPDAVYRHLEWLTLQTKKWFPILRRTAGKLGDNLVHGVNLQGKRFISIPSFTAEKEGKKYGITKRQCTAEYKVDVVERTIRRELLGLRSGQRIPNDLDITQVYGLSYDEPGRIARLKSRKAGSKLKAAFPLFEMEMTRGGCKTWLKKQVIPHEVPRSACVFCPYKRNNEWRRLRDEDPIGWHRAIEIDRAIRDHDLTCAGGMKQLQYLHDSCVPLEQADLSTLDEKAERRGQMLLGFHQECEGMCGV
jgi:hypothetical protein